MNLRELTNEQLVEESLINLAYGILVEKQAPLTFHEISTEIENLNARTNDELKAALIQFYTDMNIDGRFIVLGENRWGLREWYAIDQVEEETAPTVKARKAKKAVAEDGFDLIEEEDELELDDHIEEFSDDDEDEDEDELVGLDIIEEDIDEEDLDEDLSGDFDDEDLDDDFEDEEEEK